MPSSRAGTKIAPWVLSIILLASSRARAEDVELAAAQALFDEGRTLMSEGHAAEACPKLAESQRLAPAAGTLLNLGLCYEQQGKTASAWLTYNEALSFAAREGNAERRRLASESLADLTPKLSYVVLRFSGPVPADTWLTFDGVALGAAAWSTPLPVNPGLHVLQVGAKGRQTLTSRVRVDQPSARVPVEVAVPQIVAPSAPPPSAAPDARAKRQKVLVSASFGAGGLALAAGVYFGVRAKLAWDQRERSCSDGTCGSAGLEAGERAATYARASDLAFALGAAGLSVGTLALWLHRHRHSPERGTLRATALGRGLQLSLGGTF